LLAAISRRPLQDVLAELLARALPSAAELAQQIEAATSNGVCAVCAALIGRRDDGLLMPHTRRNLSDAAAVAPGEWVDVPCEGGSPKASDEH
jgi:hypothetical protein